MFYREHLVVPNELDGHVLSNLVCKIQNIPGLIACEIYKYRLK